MHTVYAVGDLGNPKVDDHACERKCFYSRKPEQLAQKPQHAVESLDARDVERSVESESHPARRRLCARLGQSELRHDRECELHLFYWAFDGGTTYFTVSLKPVTGIGR